MELTAIIKRGEKQFVALCPEMDVVSQGFSVDEALDNLKEAVEVYTEEMGSSLFQTCNIEGALRLSLQS